MLHHLLREGGGNVPKVITLDMIKALIFDFDSLILDTETPDLQS